MTRHASSQLNVNVTRHASSRACLAAAAAAISSLFMLFRTCLCCIKPVCAVLSLFVLFRACLFCIEPVCPWPQCVSPWQSPVAQPWQAKRASLSLSVVSAHGYTHPEPQLQHVHSCPGWPHSASAASSQQSQHQLMPFFAELLD